MAARKCVAEASERESVRCVGKLHAGFAKASAQGLSRQVKLCAEVLESEQGFGCGRASSA